MILERFKNVFYFLNVQERFMNVFERSKKGHVNVRDSILINTCKYAYPKLPDLLLLQFEA